MNISMPKIFLIAVLIGILTPVANVSAQIRRIVGKVTDNLGQPVIGAKISIKGMDNVREIDIMTDKKGDYMWLAGMQGGAFRIIVHKGGFKPAWKENIAPKTGETKMVNFQLQPGTDSKTPWDLPAKQQFAVNSANRLTVEASELMEKGDYDKAIAKLNAALAAIHALAGQSNKALNKFDDARIAYENAVKLQPQNAEYLMDLGGVLIKLGRAGEARMILNKAAELGSGSKAK
jgi:hypothetical protein